MSAAVTEPTGVESDPVHVAVTGAAGYIGSRVVAQLRSERPEWSITAIDNFYRGSLERIDDVAVEHVDIRHRDRLWSALEGADIVMHLAAISGVEDCASNPELAYEVNVTGTGNVARFCRQSGAGLIFPASMAVVGDPRKFPIRATHPRDPLNWYGRTKVVGERLIEELAVDSFPAHKFLKSNLYGDHTVDDRVVTKGTVLNFFVDRALAAEPLPVYEPGTQSRNFVHVKDVARSYLNSADVLVEQLDDDATGVDSFAIASDEDPSIGEIAEIVRECVAEERGIEIETELVDNPRDNETLVDAFPVETTRTHDVLGWDPTHTVEDTIRKQLRQAP
ncbi:NAD(P)-dependent oxidoreductase [Natrinema versiforme]|uniref:NAD-dependent epimerase/dehydratase family protein n=1 Tax=Natrinema versiforme TaxID=88724 RepID=A0A4P8WN29_9EURY|nr:NAD-dependent epimerase/dehydratase family protein [Natrinema versiforme]QCS44890.1 NAD-dependent epimerase/dehydratase family protein [Natrinema versiforme]